MLSQLKKCCVVVATSLIFGCANTTQTSNYYLVESTAPTSTLSSEKRIVLQPIQLSDYLKSSSLHVKSPSGEVLYSSTDLWAEQPSKMIWRAIQKSLEDQTGSHVLASHHKVSHCAKIQIKIDELSPSTDSKVTSAGRWFINIKDELIHTAPFSFSSNIENDGYSASNQSIALQLHQLASQLASQIEQLDLCQERDGQLN